MAAAAIRYRVADDTAADEVCYWGDATLVPHLVNLFQKPEIAVSISVSGPIAPAGNRKQFALRLHREVESLLVAV